MRLRLWLARLLVGKQYEIRPVERYIYFCHAGEVSLINCTFSGTVSKQALSTGTDCS